ncbi:MAG: oxygen-independent coproporphyrinogen III oxidase [Xanthomonadales bacterium]|nr:oxygen-independent coproporphyrinogen III oxidase [Xanthomonadales bacterium]
MIAVPTFDAGLLRRYDRPGPRYTSYPTAPQFQSGFDAGDLERAARESNDDPIPQRLSLYVHVPFCVSPCFYCGCNRVITRDLSRSAPYVTRLVREAALLAPLFDRDREVVQLHFGGGTPNFLSPDQLTEVIESLGQHFSFSRDPGRDFSIELDPRTVGPGAIAQLARAGLNRASLGVQDFDPDVQRAVNRIQTEAETLEVIRACRDSGFRSVNVDLIYGLPRQTRDGFARTLDRIVEVRPDRLAVYSYAHLPDLFKAQRQIDEADLPAPEDKLALLALAIERLTAAGYVYVGMDHFALPDDDLARAQARGDLHRNFMGYTTHANCDLVGLGVSSISHIGATYSQNPRELPAWEAAIDAGRLPVWRGLRLDADDLLRADVIQRLICQGEVEIAAVEDRHGIDFESYFAPDLARLTALAADGLVAVGQGRIRATSRGRLLLRIICACFDRYLQQPAQVPARYSRAV